MTKPPKQVSFWIDSSSKVGRGHVARCRGLIEFFLEMDSWVVNLFGSESLKSVNWLNEYIIQKKLRLHHANPTLYFKEEMLIVDTYDKKVLQASQLATHRPVVCILDNNNEGIIQSNSSLHVVLEKYWNPAHSYFTASSVRHKESYNSINKIYASIVWNSKLDEVVRLRSSDYKTAENTNKVVVSFGGSNQVYGYLTTYLDLLQERKLDWKIESVACFVSEELYQEIQNRYQLSQLISVYIFGDYYYERLAICDLLICASGTSAAEAYHLGIRSLVVEIFENASMNWMQLRKLYKQAKFIARSHAMDVKEAGKLIEGLIHNSTFYSPTLEGVLGWSQKVQIEDFLLTGQTH